LDAGLADGAGSTAAATVDVGLVAAVNPVIASRRHTQRAAAVGVVVVAVIALLARSEKTITTASMLACAWARVGVVVIAVVARLSGADKPVATAREDAGGCAEVSVDVVAVIALFLPADDPISTHCGKLTLIITLRVTDSSIVTRFSWGEESVTTDRRSTLGRAVVAREDVAIVTLLIALEQAIAADRVAAPASAIPLFTLEGGIAVEVALARQTLGEVTDEARQHRCERARNEEPSPPPFGGVCALGARFG